MNVDVVVVGLGGMGSAAVNAPTVEELDAILPVLLESLQAR